MANEGAYDSRDIVEVYLYHKLLKTGYVWEFRAAAAADADPSNNGLTDSGSPGLPGSPGSQVVARRSQAAGAADAEDAPLSRSRAPHCDPRCDHHAALHRVLREAGDEIERMYQRDFAQMPERLHFTPSTAQRKFTAVIEELFSDGVNWGRIVAFFEFGGTMCVESVNREMTSQVDNIARWMTEYLNGPLRNWIQENGGWDAFVELYGQQRGSVFRCSWPYIKTVFGLAALGAAGVTIGAYLTHK
ncbi:apoptosis regulator Bcl-2a [Scleropages formosus]|uniref:Apoptosis regulator Bcl-2 n=1 Tax=Scleropages formosus TaxID=113540 RepID=A0A8C9T5U7_SCLFO|nr:apoptosis regulator Bcl-2-like [Scleropages formosus]